MNREAFQIYGLKKSIFQATWNTNLVETSTIELASTATGTNWTGTSYALGYTHIPGIGNTASLTSAISAAIGLNYILFATITSRTAGSVTINYGGTSNAGISTTTTLNLLASTTGQLTIIPTFDFDGKIVISLRNTSAPSNQLKLPLVSTGTYNFWVDWGDGTYDNITSWNQAQRIHTYASPGTYKTRISGIITGWESLNGSNQIGDRKKLTSVSSWGKLKPSTRAFDGCSNMTLNTVSDLLDLSHLTSTQNMFSNCTALTTINRCSEWNTSTITDFNSMFISSTNFNTPLNGWNVSNSTNFGAMFANCTNFNQNLGAWNVSNCLNFVGGGITNGMFGNCTNFNNGGSSDINNWVLKSSGNITMSSMFANCANFNQPLNNWNTTRVVSMSGMFLGCTNFNQNIGSWNVSNWTTGAISMFQNATAFNNGGSPDINNWTLNTTIGVSLSLASMFTGAINFNQPLNNWNTIRVSSTSNMFNFATKFNNGLSSGVAGTLIWDTSNITNMSAMFVSDPAFNCNVGSWNVSNVADFTDMFRNANSYNNGGSPDINNWVLKSTGTISTNAMFNCLAFNQPVGNWNMSRVTTASSMFNGANTFNQNLNSWNLATCTNINSMFGGCTAFNNGNASGVGNTPTMSLNTTTPFTASSTFSSCIAFNGNLNSLDFTRCTNMSALVAFSTNYNNGLASGVAGVMTINTSNVTNMAQMFQGCVGFNQDIGLFNVSKVTSFNTMFFNTYAYNNGADVNPINNWTLNTTVGANIDMTNMFGGNQGTKVFNRALNNWNTSEVTLMAAMFVNSGGTAVFDQPIDNWVMSKVTNTSNMFTGNNTFNQSLSNWERVGSTMANVVNMSFMFSQSIFNNGLASGISGILTWNTSNVTSMSNMFIYNSRFNQCIGGWNVSKVTNFGNMFIASTSFNNGDDSLPINNWVLNNTVGANISLAGLFGSNLGNMIFNRNISSWNTSKVTNMSSMFDRNPAFQQYIGAWDVSNVTNFTTFMSTKTPSTFPSTYLDNIYNGWIVNTVKPNLIISFGTAKYTQAAKAGRNTLTSSVISGGYNWTIADGLLTVSGTSNNGGLIRVTTNTNGFTTGASVLVNVYGVNGTIAANGTWTALVISSTVIQLQGSTYDAAWTSGGNVILG